MAWPVQSDNSHLSRISNSDFKAEAALGKIDGTTVWNKFGYNSDIDVGTEVIAAFGGTFTPLTEATTLYIQSTSLSDDLGASGAEKVLIYGIDANRKTQTEIVTVDRSVPVTTTNTWLGVNRMVVYQAGSSNINAGIITAKATSDDTTQASIPVGEGTTQQCIFFVQSGYQALAEWLTINTLRQSAQQPIVTVKGWVYSPITGTKYEVMRESIDTAIDNHIELMPPIPFPLGDGAVFWLEATTDKDDTILNARFSLLEIEL